MPLLCVALGSNMGDRRAKLIDALHALNEQIGSVAAVSPFIETAPQGFDSDGLFLNAAALLRTDLRPEAILHRTQSIEQRLGRLQKSNPRDGYADRPIDIDLLLYDSLVIETDQLTIPHPLMHKRDFVLLPLSRIAPTWVHPVLNRTIIDLFHDVRN